MPNPFKQPFGGGGTMPVGNLAPLKNMLSMLRATQNPQAALQMLAQKNPQVAQAMNMCRGKNPRDVFFAECKTRGIDPNEIIARYRA